MNNVQIIWLLNHVKSVICPFASFLHILLLFFFLLYPDMSEGQQVRNAALGIVARRISWQQLTVMETIDGEYLL